MSQLRKILYRLFVWTPLPELKAAEEEIDVVIPIIAKDLKILPLCLEGVRKCVANKVKDIYIVAPDDARIRDFCREQHLKFVEEKSVFGYSPKEIGLVTADGSNRSGWLFQQFVKLSAKIGTCRHYLCIDADHVLVRPHVFLTDRGRTVFYMSYEKHRPYYALIERLLPGTKLAPLSYVAHKMLFDKEQVRALQRQLSERNGGKPWQQVILDSIDRRELSGFSEFETYGNFVTDKVLRPWKQKTLHHDKIADYDTLRKRYGRGRWSVTFPEYYG